MTRGTEGLEPGLWIVEIRPNGGRTAARIDERREVAHGGPTQHDLPVPGVRAWFAEAEEALAREIAEFLAED